MSLHSPSNEQADKQKIEQLSHALSHIILENTATLNDSPLPLTFLEEHQNAIFLFADMQGYSELSKKISTPELVKLMGGIYHDFSKIIKKEGATCGIEIIKLSADCIMLGACTDKANLQIIQAKSMVKIALALSSHLMALNKESKQPINFRFGINIGPAAKVLCQLPQGNSIDWLGEGVNMASRMEASGLPNQVQITQKMYDIVKNDFECSPCQHTVKSYDRPVTYFVIKENPGLAKALDEMPANFTPLNTKLSSEKRKSRSSPELSNSLPEKSKIAPYK